MADGRSGQKEGLGKMASGNGWLVPMIVFWFVVGGCSSGAGSGGPAHSGGRQANSQQSQQNPVERKLGRIRPPAVAGLFYPADSEKLVAQLDRCLDEASPDPVPALRALVCPHAGYDYSGPVAAWGYKLLAGQRFKTVVVLAPSHYADFRGASIPEVDGYRTPLGVIPLSPLARRLAQRPPFGSKIAARVHRPEWSIYSAAEPVEGRETPHTWEHSLEVQLPFLQRTLGEFELLPVVFGRVDAQQAAAVLEPLVDEQTLIVASSDLSHYHPYDEARRLDLACVDAICRLDCQAMQNQEACGQLPVLTLMYLARAKGWKAKLLDYRNSGDTSGDRSAVVGYAAIAFYQPDAAGGEQQSTAIEQAPSVEQYLAQGGQAGSADEAHRPEEPQAALQQPPVGQSFGSAERAILLELARRAIHSSVTTGKLPEVDPGDLPDSLKERRACFVTLTKGGELRGCIGTILPEEPLWEAVMRRARSAALEDPRFPPVTAGELDELEIEVSVLTVPKPVSWSTPGELLEKLRPGIDGVVLRAAGRQATFLPQVWDKLPDKEQFMARLSEKAGLLPSAWKNPGTTVLTYQVEAFSAHD